MKKEMSKCYPNLITEIDTINPQLVFLLGKQVSDFVLSEFDIDPKSTSSDFEYQSYTSGRVKFIPIHHPSFVLIYKRKYIEDYVSGIGKHIRNVTSPLAMS